VKGESPSGSFPQFAQNRSFFGNSRQNDPIVHCFKGVLFGAGPALAAVGGWGWQHLMTPPPRHQWKEFSWVMPVGACRLTEHLIIVPFSFQLFLFVQVRLHR
jgi:hypothetical protein